MILLKTVIPSNAILDLAKVVRKTSDLGDIIGKVVEPKQVGPVSDGSRRWHGRGPGPE
jgi:hypothetical protein